jgi:phospholipid transport system substrate-binding protein
VVLLVLTLFAAVPPREAAAGGATDALKDFFGSVNAVLTDPTTEDRPLERLRAIRRHVDDVFDFREAAMLALGREWTARTPTEQNEFVALFADLLERSFVWRVAGKATTAGGVKVDYLDETLENDTASVETAIAARDGNTLRLGFRLIRRAERWVVRDVVMDGVSTMENYHAQFQRLARDGSWPELIAQLRAKVGVPAGVQVATAPPPMMWPSELRAPDRVVEPMVPVPLPPVPSAIARPLETAVVPARTAQYAAPAPTQGPSAAPATAPVTTTSDSTPAPAAARPVIVPREAPAMTIVQREAPPVVPVREIALAKPEPVRLAPRIEPPPPVVRPLVPKPTTSTWWVQVGAYRNAGAAGRVAAQVHGEILVVATPASPSSPLLRVRVGPFSDRARAQARLRALESQGWRAFIAEGSE